MSKPVIKYPLGSIPSVEGLDFERIVRIFNETGILFYDGEAPLVIKGVGNDAAIQLIRNSTKPTQEDIDWAKTKIVMRKALKEKESYPFGKVGSENQEPNKSEKI